MAATEQNIQEQIQQTLKEKAIKALLPQIGKSPAFFKPNRVISEMLPILEARFAKLLYCVGHGQRMEAEQLFKAGPGLLLWRGNLTDIAKKTYEDSTVFEYAVKVKDSYFVRKVINFLETYQGKERKEIVADLLEQFDRSFNEERLASVNGFIEASNAWRAAFPNRTWDERDRHFVQDVGEAQAKFPAHILQEYCHPTRSFDPTPQFNEAELPESLDFCNWNSGSTPTLLITSPGVSGNFTLIRGDALRAAVGGLWFRVPLEVDCAAVDALDKARTVDLLELRKRLAAVLTVKDSHELHEPALSCSSSVPS